MGCSEAINKGCFAPIPCFIYMTDIEISHSPIGGCDSATWVVCLLKDVMFVVL